MKSDLMLLGDICKFDDGDGIPVRHVTFDAANPSFMTRCLPYLKSAHSLSLRKRNLSMDEAEDFILTDATNRTQAVMSTVNAAYFLQDRCMACGADLEADKHHTHHCAFFCVAACEQETTNTTRIVIAFVEFNVLATTRTDLTTSVPCVSVHVLSPSQLLSACLSVVDALLLILARCKPSIHVPSHLETLVPCPTMLFRDMLRVDVTCLHSIIAFYVEAAIPKNWAINRKTAIARVLLAVGEYVLRTCVRKPMIVPFVPVSVEAPDITRHCVWVPMRQLIQTLQGSKLRVPAEYINYQYTNRVNAVPLNNDDEKREFLCFLSQFLVQDKDVNHAFQPWTHERVLGSVRGDLQKHFNTASTGQSNDKLKLLLYAVRCFFYANQQTYFRSELLIVDTLCLSCEHFLEVEMRFLLLLFRKCVSRQPILFDVNDICDVICPAM